MKQQIAIKDNKCITDSVITLLLILILLSLCVFNAIRNIHGISMEIVYIGFSLVLVFWFIKELKTLIMQIKLPNELISIDNEHLYIYTDKENIVNINDVTEIKQGVVIRKLLANEASLIINTKNNSYKVIYIKDIEKVIEKLSTHLKVGE